MTNRIHHSAICTRDIEGSLRFWRDGLLFSPTMDFTFEGDWKTLFNAPEDSLHSVFLGPPGDPDGSGILELVDFGEVPVGPGAPTAPQTGFFLISVYLDIEETLTRLTEIGLADDLRRVTVTGGVKMAVVRDPNGVLVELIDSVTVLASHALTSAAQS
jgi:catechol 2,3-dioxygenase-like lactoylglutathione lyase family enzyme